ncbi:hypothetical protein J6590_093960 [Homalodisca vitripennis]|nr:hypothetical protein J6590_093960 [Homalodisca vitripennis]
MTIGYNFSPDNHRFRRHFQESSGPTKGDLCCVPERDPKNGVVIAFSLTVYLQPPREGGRVGGRKGCLIRSLFMTAKIGDTWKLRVAKFNLFRNVRRGRFSNTVVFCRI